MRTRLIWRQWSTWDPGLSETLWSLPKVLITQEITVYSSYKKISK